MRFDELVDIVGDQPIFETGFLLAGDVDPKDVHRQLSRWKATGRVLQLRRGLYALASPYCKCKPHPFVIANRIVRGSYVSCQSALAYYNLIPEYVPNTVSVTTGRPALLRTPLGVYEFHHIKTAFFLSFKSIDVTGEYQSFVATPEKALLDLVHLQFGGDTPHFLRELRLQNLEVIDKGELLRIAEVCRSQKLKRAVYTIEQLINADELDYEIL